MWLSEYSFYKLLLLTVVSISWSFINKQIWLFNPVGDKVKFLIAE